ncbi:4'-phosphopantetheinyl transferase superfamily protein [Streptomyces sp. NPDC006632]|uniref:4'-phosphopantetheinyl transferase family protein n=1 Tax=Streptomyces sp. NPDC006632 TaxID=3157182 RepID=UPI0033BE2E8B
MTHPATGGNGGGASCEVWWARTAYCRPGLAALLTRSETVRRDLYARADDRDRFAVSAALVRLAAARQLGLGARDITVVRDCPDCPLPHGRPRIEGARLDVSVSYAGSVVVVAVSHGARVGVDVETVGLLTSRHAAVLQRALGADELSTLEKTPEDARATWLLRRWTYKEAVVKATGDGLRVPLPGIQLCETSAMTRLASYPGRPELLDGRTVLMPVDAPPGFTDPESMASSAFLMDRGMSIHRVRSRDAWELFDSERSSELVDRVQG